MPDFAFPHSRSLRTKISFKESQGEDSDDELDEVDEEVSSSAVFLRCQMPAPFGSLSA